MFSKFILPVLVLILAIFMVSGVKAAEDVDTSFKATAYANDATSLNKIAIQSDGKILVSGGFTVADGVPVVSIVRLNVDGDVDSGFKPPIFTGSAGPRLGGYIFDIGIQSDGKIVVVGSFGIGTNYTNRNITRLNADGSLDTTFADLSSQFANGGSINSITINTDNSIYITGSFTFSSGSSSTSNIAKLNADGTINFSSTFPNNGNGIAAIAFQSDGKILAGGVRLVRYTTAGNTDSSFPSITNDGGISAILIQPDGKIVIVGSFTNINGFSQGRISRLNADGSIDTTFNPGGIGSDNAISTVTLGADGKFLITGGFRNYNNTAQKFTARLNADGTLDNSFTLDASLNSTVFSPVTQNDGRILLGVSASRSVYRLNSNGSIDSSFRRTTVGRGGVLYDIVQQPDGKILATGFISVANEVPQINIVRYNLDGTVDTSFNGYVGTFSRFMRLALQADGRIVVVGSSSSQGTGRPFRLNFDGSLDTSFNPSISNTGDVKILSDGKILLGSTRVTSSGGTDNTYSNPTLNNTVYANKALADGKYLVGGEFTQVNGVSRGRIARLNNDGTLDTTFNPPLGANGTIYGLDVQANGKIILIGDFSGLNGVSRPYIGQLNIDGSLDTSFMPTVNGGIRSIKIQPDGKILIGGIFTTVNGIPRNRYARLNIDGSIDTSFIVNNTGDTNTEEVNKITLQSDGNILIGGYFSRIRNYPAANIARLLNNTSARTPFDFDGDGRADISVFRPSNGFWYQLKSQNNAFNAFQFGQAGDKPAPADYDGDGKTDIAVFRDVVPGAGNQAYFYITYSSNNSFRDIPFGTAGDVPMSGDWDGDGIADLAVYRSASTVGGQSYFIYRASSIPNAGFTIIPWGTFGDKPVTGDFDGDGKLDAAVFRPSNATWYVVRSSNGQAIVQQLGVATDIPAPADYDGDGTTNFAVFRPSTGYWYTSTNPQTNYGGVQFGAAGDVPVAADYDGDGKADVAVYRPSNGAWYLLRSTAGFTGVQFGTAEDKPIPATNNR